VAEFEQVLAYLDDREIAYDVDHLLVRGLDYYCHTAFEVTSSELGAQDAIGGGGRYDGLARELGSPNDLPAVGFAVGMERLMIVMEKQGLFATLNPRGPLVCVIVQQQELASHAMQVAFRLRKAGIKTEIDLAARSMKAQMREANRMNSAYALIVGQSEFESGIYALKNLITSEQTSIDLDALIGILHEPSIRDALRS
jgi:histidyl-tRNA synthetase